jgi:hypothetical protein
MAGVPVTLIVALGGGKVSGGDWPCRPVVALEESTDDPTACWAMAEEEQRDRISIATASFISVASIWLLQSGDCRDPRAERYLTRDSSDEPEFEVDSSEFPGCSEVPPAFVAVRRQSGSGAAFLGRRCLFFLGIWAQSSRRLLLNA